MGSNKNNRSRRKYDDAFKQDVLKMIESGRSVPDVANALGVTSSLIYRWVKLADATSVKSPAQSSQPNYDPEKVALQKKIRELEMEREILKKALGIFSRQTQ
ncbi:transposase [Flavitalea antarctica]